MKRLIMQDYRNQKEINFPELHFNHLSNISLNMTTIQKLTALLLMAVLPFGLSAQKWFTRDAKVSFDATSANSPERIEATNKSGTFVLDQASGRLETSTLIKGFQFEKALMQEHFNENYLESSKFPKATFKGKIDDLAKVKFDQNGTYKTTVSGDLTLHGVTKTISTPATFTVKDGKISVAANFSALLADYGVSIPSLVADKLAKEAKIVIGGTLEKMK